MRRLVATFVVVLTASTTLLPAALATVVNPQMAHACCVRNRGSQHCSATAQPALSALGSCCHGLQPSSVRVSASRISQGFDVQPIPVFSYASEFYPQAEPQHQAASQDGRSPPSASAPSEQ
jgi:hypothetical protein